MPPDPRGGNLGIRSATFKRQPGQLDYQVLVMREERNGAPFKGTLTFSIDGSYPNGRAATITPEGPTLNVDRYDYALAVSYTHLDVYKRQAVGCALVADLAGVLAAIGVCYWFFG